MNKMLQPNLIMYAETIFSKVWFLLLTDSLNRGLTFLFDTCLWRCRSHSLDLSSKHGTPHVHQEDPSLKVIENWAPVKKSPQYLLLIIVNDKFYCLNPGTF